MVNASRRHLTERYASGVDLLLWETEKRLIPDLDAIKSVTDAAASGQAEGLDMGAALVLVQAARLALDRLECELFEAAHAMGMRSEAIAAVLDLPDAARRTNGNAGSRPGGRCRMPPPNRSVRKPGGPPGAPGGEARAPAQDSGRPAERTQVRSRARDPDGGRRYQRATALIRLGLNPSGLGE